MKNKNHLFFYVIVAIILGIIVGPLVGKEKTIFSLPFYTIFDVVSTMFLNALSLLIAPLIISSIIVGISQKNSKETSIKKLSIKTLFTFISLNILALIIGWIIASSFHTYFSKATTLVKMQKTQEAMALINSNPQMTQFFLQIIPSNLFEALAKNQILGLIVFSLLFGFALTKISLFPLITVKRFFQGIFQTIIEMIHFIMKFLPIGIFCLIAKQFATTGFSAIKPVVSLLIAAICAFFVLACILLMIIKWFIKIPIFEVLKKLSSALITGFSTSSSSATLPITLDCLEKKIGIPNQITSLTLPLSTSLNMAASAMYALVSIIFLTHIYGIDLSLAHQMLLFCITLLASFGMPSIPSGGLFSIIVILQAMNLPIEGISFLFILDRFIDMPRTMMNVFVGSTSTMIIAKLENKKLFTN